MSLSSRNACVQCCACLLVSSALSGACLHCIVLMSLNSIEGLVFDAETSFLSLELLYLFSLYSNACLDVSQLSAAPVFIPHRSLIVLLIFLSLHLTAFLVFILVTALMSLNSQGCLYFHCIAFFLPQVPVLIVVIS
jgi:hypothetical protein